MEREAGLSRRMASTLEAGRGLFARSGSLVAGLADGAARAWGERAVLAVPLAWRAPGLSRALVTVGGATLGGDGKTRLAIACVRHLARQSAREASDACDVRVVRVALVGHAYRARPGRARVVGPADPVQLVGDEALVAALRLAPLAPRAFVVVGPDRDSAIELAFARADVVVLDGTLQVAPHRASLALLAQSTQAPWGSGLCPPRGDLRASRERLLRHADLAVPVPDAEPDVLLADGRLHGLDSLAGWRLGLFTALARPQRIVEALARAGLAPVVHLEAADHGEGTARTAARLARLAQAHRLDAWVATDKCASAFMFRAEHPPRARVLGAPMFPLVPRPEALSPELMARLADVRARLEPHMCWAHPHAGTLSIAAQRPAPS